MKRFFVAVLSLCSFAAFAQDAMSPDAGPTEPPAPPPSAEAVKAVWDFHARGQGGGAVLGEAKLCLEIVKDGPQKNECGKEVPPEGVKAGTAVLVWQAYFLPENEVVEDIQLQVKQGNTVRETKDVSKLEGKGWRNRTWSSVTLKKAGDWTLTLMRGDKTLKAFNVKAF